MHEQITTLFVFSWFLVRRVSSRSLLALEELCRGQDGELAVGSATELATATVGYGGLAFVVSCALSEETGGHINWQWWQGRLVLLDMLLSQFPLSFELPTDRGEQHSFTNLYDRLCLVLQFAAKATNIQHMRVTKLARRVFVRVVRFGAHVPQAVQYMRQLIDSLQDAHRTTLARRLSLIVGESSSVFRNVSASDLSSSFQAGSPSANIKRAFSGGLKPVRGMRDNVETDGGREDASTDRAKEPLLLDDAVAMTDKEKESSERKVSIPDKESQLSSPPPHVFDETSHKRTSDPADIKAVDPLSSLPSPHRPSIQPEFPPNGVCKDMDADEAEAVVQAMEASESRLPVLSSLAPPDDLVTVHIQEGAEGASPDQRDGSNVYVEGIHWKKGARIGTGAFCTCFLARDIKTGALMALKQVCCIPSLRWTDKQ